VEVDVRGRARRYRGVPGVGVGRASRKNQPENLQPNCTQARARKPTEKIAEDVRDALKSPEFVQLVESRWRFLGT